MKDIKKKRLIEEVNLNIARKITINQARDYGVLPIYEKDDRVYIASFGDKEKAKDLLSFLLKKKLVFVEHDKQELLCLIDIILDFNYENIEEIIFKEAIQCKASDIHFEPVRDGLNIRFRVNGLLMLVRKLKYEEYFEISSRLKIKAGMDITEKRRPQDGKLFIKVGKENYNCRLSTLPIVDGEKIVLRILYSDKFLCSLESLNFSLNQIEDLRKIISLKNGLILVNGPTGSGKSTTLYSIINEIREDDINITTLEDPIEVQMKGINQISLNPKIGITFADGLRSVLRQDPDVIMVGEIRDEETAKMAVRAAITGHKVYSTIHTKSPREVYLRLEEMGVKNYLIKDSLNGIISQRLVKTLCDNCKKEINKEEISGKCISIYTKAGCNFCGRSGYMGRTLISSVFYIDKTIKNDLKNIYYDEAILSNNQMKEGLNKLLYNGEIDYYDYLNIIEGEELCEG